MTPYYEDLASGIVLYHGDCREVLAWLAADVLLMDPPYGMSFVSNAGKWRRPIAGDHSTDVRDAARRLWGTGKPAAVFGTWRCPRPAGTRQRLIWDKTDGTGPGMGHLGTTFGNSDEEIYLLGEWRRYGPRRGSVLRTSEAMGSPFGLAARTGHPTPKPVALLARLIRATAPGASLADPFAGSGSTLVAAKLLGRRAIGVEIEERYCEMAARRLSQMVLPLELGA